jgi:hypothetical protein
MAAKIGYFLRSFRLQSQGRRLKAYSRDAVINALRSHVPENHHNHHNHHDANYHASQSIDNKQLSDTCDTCDGSARTEADANSEQPKHRVNEPKKSWTGGLTCPGCRGTWGSGSGLSAHLQVCKQFDFGAMKLTESQLAKEQTVAPELLDRYQCYIKLGLGPLAGGGQA